jgi:ubiquinone/menaquinone biosynthesis C-methylase UbiE
VKTPAAIAGTSETISARSGNPEGLSPAAIPAARKPFGAVTLPEMTCQFAIKTPLGRYLFLINASDCDGLDPHLNVRKELLQAVFALIHPEGAIPQILSSGMSVIYRVNPWFLAPMTSASASIGLASRFINGALAIAPLANLLKHQARAMMIKRAESIGVQWTQDAETLRSRGADTWNSALEQIQNPKLAYPLYYLQPFHAYKTGNLSWEAATEVEVAAYAAHARIWSEAGSKAGDARLRESFHTRLKQQIPSDPHTILDLGCSVGMSTFALQDTYPNATVTGLDLSPYFLAIAQYRTQETQRSLQWVHAAAEATPFADQTFDLVSTCLMLHELPQHATHAILKEAHRLLKPGGHLAIMDMNPKSDVFTTLPPYVFTLLKSTEPYLDEYFTLDLSQSITQAGFHPPFRDSNSPRHCTLIAKTYA